MRGDTDRAAEYSLGVQRLAAQVNNEDDDDVGLNLASVCRFVTRRKRGFVALRTRS